MASIHIDEIRHWLLENGRADGVDENGEPRIEFLEIRFDDRENREQFVIDNEMVEKVLPFEAYFGSGVLQFDERGCLKSIDFS